MDETTPHLHLVFVPVIHTKDKNGKTIDKIACSEYWKGKDSYKKLQDNFHEYITKAGFNLERGKQRKIEHLSTEKFKQVTNFDSLKYEITKEEIKLVETQNTVLIVVQNKELVIYANKLKEQLAKSYIAIQRSENLQKENVALKQENQKLQRKICRLENYIEKTFEVVKQLFSFPMDRFKRLVDNFVKHFEK